MEAIGHPGNRSKQSMDMLPMLAMTPVDQSPDANWFETGRKHDIRMLHCHF